MDCPCAYEVESMKKNKIIKELLEMIQHQENNMLAMDKKMLDLEVRIMELEKKER